MCKNNKSTRYAAFFKSSNTRFDYNSDTAAYWAVYCEVDEDAGFTSIDMKIDFLAPFDRGIIMAKGKSIKIGKTMCLAEATVFDEKGKWLAHGTSKMIVTEGLQTIGDALKFTGTEALPPKFI